MGEAKRRGSRAQRVEKATQEQQGVGAATPLNLDDLVMRGFVVRHRDSIKLLIGMEANPGTRLCTWAADAAGAMRFATQRKAQSIVDELDRGETVGQLYEDQDRYYVGEM